jgi:hypothetical protein
MFESLCWLTGGICLAAIIASYSKYRDPFHPAMILIPMCGFIYVLMPLKLARDGALFSYISETQAEWVQGIIIAGLIALILGITQGSHVDLTRQLAKPPARYRPEIIWKGALILGALGLLAWIYTIKNAGGFLQVFGHGNGRGWSEQGYIRETVYLIIVALLLLFTPQVYRPKNQPWLAAAIALSIPYVIQGLLGAQRGPTFQIAVTLGVSWYMAQGKRPSLLLITGAGLALGFLMLFLVNNRGSIYLGSDRALKTDVSGTLDASEANEYIFGAGCMIASNQTGDYFWGKRYLAQIVVRPVPRQLWPNKYADFGVAELEENAGVAKAGLGPVMGWTEIPGAAGAMVADLWVECSWLAIPVLWLIGYAYGSIWKRAVSLGGSWNTQYTILVLLSIYLVTQSGEAVIFRLFILSLPAQYVWKKARYA